MTLNQQPPSETAQERVRSADQHRQETWLLIVLPMVGAVLAFVALLVLTLMVVLIKRPQVAALSDWLLTVWVLCPLALCILPVYLLMAMAAFGVGKLHDTTGKPLRRLNDVSANLSQRVIQTGEALSRKSIVIASTVALLDKVWGIFDLPDSEGQVQEKEHDATDTE